MDACELDKLLVEALAAATEDCPFDFGPKSSERAAADWLLAFGKLTFFFSRPYWPTWETPVVDAGGTDDVDAVLDTGGGMLLAVFAFPFLVVVEDFVSVAEDFFPPFFFVAPDFVEALFFFFTGSPV